MNWVIITYLELSRTYGQRLDICYLWVFRGLSRHWSCWWSSVPWVQIGAMSSNVRQHIAREKPWTRKSWGDISIRLIGVQRVTCISMLKSAGEGRSSVKPWRPKENLPLTRSAKVLQRWRFKMEWLQLYLRETERGIFHSRWNNTPIRKLGKAI